MSAIVIDLPWTRPPLRANDRRGWQAQHRSFQAALNDARWAIRAAKPRRVVGANVTLHYRPATKRLQDPDGIFPSLKPALDALVAEGILPDDCWPHVEAATCRLHEPEKPAACWLTLDVLTEWEAA